MRTRQCLMVIFMHLAPLLTVPAATWHVATNGNDADHNGTGGWDQAYATVSNALVKSGSGDLILISNGTYNINVTLTNNARQVQGWSGNPADTIIDGGLNVRCLYMAHTNSLAAGITIANGMDIVAGGVYLNSGATLSNCIVTGCIASSTNKTDPNLGGGGITINAGGRVLGCTIVNNVSSNFGGGIIKRTSSWGLIEDCTIASNTAAQWGGGIYNYNGGLAIRECIVASNSAQVYGGGIAMSIQGRVENCRLEHNISTASGGGVFMEGSNCFCCNSLMVSNTAVSTSHGGGGVYVLKYGNVENCTIVDNSGGNYGGGLRYYSDTATAHGYFRNNIIYGNTVTTGSSSNWLNGGTCATNGSYLYCCVAPTGGAGWDGAESTDAPPGLVEPAAGNYRLAAGSPCINAGTNLDWMAGAVDLDGRRRLDRFSGAADMGCYEYTAPGSLIAIH